MLKRALRVCIAAIVILMACAVGVALSRAGFGIPCMFHLITGLDCPGCGITRMLGALAEFDLESAFRANAGLLIWSPVLVIFAVWMTVDYIRLGRKRPTKTQNILLYASIVFLAVFAVFRNLPWYPFG